MTYGSVLASASVLQKLINQPLHLRQAYQMTKIARRINEELDFFYAKKDEIDKMECTDEEKIEKMNELVNLEIDWDLEPVRLSPEDKLELSASDLEMANDVIKVEEQETKN